MKTSVFIFLLCALLVSVNAQQPFVTDDADVTEKGKFHFEFSNNFDLLQRSSYPVEKQNTASFELGYGLVKNVEISVEAPIITLISDSGAGGLNPKYVTGIGDTNLAVKYNFRKEREGSRLPAMSFIAALEIPTGDASRQLGSGIADFGVNFIAQKTFREKNVWRVNAGTIFSGNTVTGVQGIAARGVIFTGGSSIVRAFSDKLQLGVEATGAVTRESRLGAGLLQFQAGGNYRLTKNSTFDFGVIAGRFAASPRIGAQIGFAVDF